MEASMRTTTLRDIEVSRIGLGAMGMSGTYGAADEAESVRTIHRALDLGVSLIDTAEVYGPFHNEELVGRAIKNRRDDVVLAPGHPVPCPAWGPSGPPHGAAPGAWRESWLGRAAFVGCPKPSVTTSFGARARPSSPARTARRPRRR